MILIARVIGAPGGFPRLLCSAQSRMSVTSRRPLAQKLHPPSPMCVDRLTNLLQNLVLHIRLLNEVV
jgi:hypothetical protein